MNKNCTSIQQSQKLITLGIDANTADMSWYRATEMFPFELHTKYVGHGTMEGDELIPAWSLSALLELMPKDKERIFDVTFGYYDNDDNYIKEWCCSYLDNTTDEELPLAEAFHGDNSLDAAFEMIVWLKKNRKI